MHRTMSVFSSLTEHFLINIPALRETFNRQKRSISPATVHICSETQFSSAINPHFSQKCFGLQHKMSWIMWVWPSRAKMLNTGYIIYFSNKTKKSVCVNWFRMTWTRHQWLLWANGVIQMVLLWVMCSWRYLPFLDLWQSKQRVRVRLYRNHDPGYFGLLLALEC